MQTDSEVLMPWQGWVQDFHLEGAPKAYVRSSHDEREEKSPLQPGSRTRLRALESLGF